MSRFLVSLAFVATACLGWRGRELGRITLEGAPSTGLVGRGAWVAGTKAIHLDYDAVRVDTKYLPRGTLELALERDGKVVATTSCSNEADGPGFRRHRGSGGTIGTRRHDCEDPVGCTITAPTGDAYTLRAKLRFDDPSKLRAIHRMQVVLRE